MLSYHREIELHGALVLAKSGRLELGDDIIIPTLYSVSQKSSPPKTFCGIISPGEPV